MYNRLVYTTNLTYKTTQYSYINNINITVFNTNTTQEMNLQIIHYKLYNNYYLIFTLSFLGATE